MNYVIDIKGEVVIKSESVITDSELAKYLDSNEIYYLADVDEGRPTFIYEMKYTRNIWKYSYENTALAPTKIQKTTKLYEIPV